MSLSCKSCKSYKNGRFWKKMCKTRKITYFLNHLAPKATLLSSPNIYFFQHIFKLFSLEFYKQRNRNCRLFLRLSSLFHTYMMRMEMTWRFYWPYQWVIENVFFHQNLTWQHHNGGCNSGTDRVFFHVKIMFFKPG